MLNALKPSGLGVIGELFVTWINESSRYICLPSARHELVALWSILVIFIALRSTGLGDNGNQVVTWVYEGE